MAPISRRLSLCESSAGFDSPTTGRSGAAQPRLIAALLATSLTVTGCSSVERVGSRIASWLPDFGRRPALNEPLPTPPPRDARPLTSTETAMAAPAPAGPTTNAMELAVPPARPPDTLAGAPAAPVLTAEARALAPAPVAVAAPAQLTPARPAAAPAATAAPVARPAVLATEAADDNTVVGRMRRVEAGLAQLQQQFDVLKPSIERLVAIEDDLDELVAQLFTVITREGTAAAAAPTTGAARPATAPPTAGGAPLSLLPGQTARPPTPAAAPTTVAAATPPAVAAGVAAPVAQTGAFALHLASYRRVETAAEGWAALTREMPQQLSGLRPGTSVFDKEREGRYFRLMAGPVASRGDAEARCRAIQQAGEYCAVMPYAGTTPLP